MVMESRSQCTTGCISEMRKSNKFPIAASLLLKDFVVS